VVNGREPPHSGWYGLRPQDFVGDIKRGQRNADKYTNPDIHFFPVLYGIIRFWATT
jgi:hypothetical protein